NTVTERQLLNAVFNKLKRDFLSPENIAKLRAEIRRRAEARVKNDPAKAKQLRQQIQDLDRQINQGSERLLLLPADLVADAAAKLREWKEQRRQLQLDLECLEKPVQAVDDLDAWVEAAARQIRTLRENIGKADPAKSREVIHQMVQRVECWFGQ